MKIKDDFQEQVEKIFNDARNSSHSGYLVSYEDFTDNQRSWVIMPDYKNDLMALSLAILIHFKGMCNSSIFNVLNLNKPYEESDTGLSEPLNELLLYIQRGYLDYPGNQIKFS
jgi:hypothetical protein